MISNLELDAKAIELRSRMGEDANSPIDIFSMATGLNDLTLLLYPLGEHISGMCIRQKDSNVIAVNSTMSYGRQRFSLAHEFYHLFFDYCEGITVSAKNFDTSIENEKNADRFASFFLAPNSALRLAIQKHLNVSDRREPEGRLSVRDVIALEQLFGMSHQAMLWRLYTDGFLSKTEKDSMNSGIIRLAKSYGYDSKLYLPMEEASQKKTYGNYIVQAETLKERGMISIEKYEELLLDAFRYDIVYGEDEPEGGIDD